MTLELLKLSLEDMNKSWVTVSGIVIPLGDLWPHALQLLLLDKVSQQHRPPSVASGRYTGTSRRHYLG
jgi:hypothetical protein